MDILSNPSQRLPLETLLKCEAVLDKMNLIRSEPVEQAQPAPAPISTSSNAPLLEAIVKVTKQVKRSHDDKLRFTSFWTPIYF